ncbi:autotransporter outer membrane beta-barrel domain-containing protein [Hydrogenophaga sp.]|uniref:autotransporter outer membrane beta-barrel domain-containing protein n=1 Tax=Hydrogenophaga sp. TaxID=1904254 RepID=UPI002728EF97|nr:autotransporter outer membrane beta-barrel domain-containing protein [Hydrogenophaga sp.]MDO9435487.1 autotransporter outer membrane beta-barrel domain-containing protein [Hydrogenophaga sp.]
MSSTRQKKYKRSAQRPHALATEHRLSPTSPHATLLSMAMLAAFVAWSTPARAANECGAPVFSQVFCSDPAQNPYALGITYSTATSLSVQLSGINVSTSGLSLSGLRLSGSGSGALQAILANDATIITNGALSDGMSVTSTNSDAIFVIVQGNITTSTPAVVPGPSPTAAGVSARALGALNGGTVMITQGATSTIQGNGVGTAGLYGLTEGLGVVSIASSGYISLLGNDTRSIQGHVANLASAAAVNISQAQTGRLETTGDRAIGIYALNEGLGGAQVAVAGQIDLLGIDNDGVLSAVMNANSVQQAAVELTATARVGIRGAGSNGVHVVNAGRGTSSLVSRGTVTTIDSESVGLFLETTSSNNTADHTVQLAGNGSVQTYGGSSHGIRAVADGPAQLAVDLQDNAQVLTGGATAHGVDALALGIGSSATVSTGASTFIGVLGRESIAARTRADGSATANVQGQIFAFGEYGVGVYANSLAGVATVNVAQGANVLGGWQAGPDDTGPDLTLRSAGVVLSSGGTSVLNNAGTIGSDGDRAVMDDSPLLPVPPLPLPAPAGNLTINNTGTITGFVQLATGGANAFNNNAAGVFDVRHFADTDGDGTRDEKRIALSDFGDGTTSVFNNAGTVRLAAVGGNPSVNPVGYYLPTTGIASTPLDNTFYRLDRADVAQGQLTNLGTFRHSGTLDLRGPAVGNSLVITSNAAAGGAAGTGTFIADGGDLYLNAVLNDGINSHADMLVVDRTQLGVAPTNVHVGVDASSLGAYTPGNGIQLVEVRDKTASAAGVFVLSGPVSSGAFDYQLFHNGVGIDSADGNWYLRNFLVLPGGSGTVPTYRAETPVYMALPALTSRLGLAMLGNYHDRLGEDRLWSTARASDTAQRVGWGRLFGQSGETGSRNGSALQQTNSFQKHGPAYDYDLSGLQVGMDLNRAARDNHTVDTTGAYFGVSDIKGTVDEVLGGAAGGSKVDAYSLGGYWSRKMDNGAYIDAVFQASYYKGHAWTNRGQRINTRGWGHVASLEGGLSHALGNGWAIEPQAQLVFQRISLDGDQDQFAQVDFNRNKSWYARLGARLTKNAVSSAGLQHLSWARVNVWHNLGSKARTTFSDLSGQNAVSLNTALGGVWGQLQVGHSLRFSASASAFVSLDYSFALDGAKGHALGGRVGFKLAW